MAQASAAPVVFSTNAPNASDGLDAWREWFHPILDISPARTEGGQFHSENKVWDIGGLLLSSVVASAARTTRGKLNISRAPIDHWVISYNRYGVTEIAATKSTLHAPPGVPFLWSLGDQTSTYRSDVDRVQLLIPRDMFRDIAPMLDATRGSLLNTPLGATLGNYLLFLESNLRFIAPNDVQRLTTAVRGMIAACIAPSDDRLNAAASQIDYVRRERIRRMIHSNLRSPKLGPDVICKSVGISRSQLYRLFEGSGGVLRYIQRQRLLQCHAIFSDPENDKRVLSAAEEFGFNNISSFHRAFKREFGQSPREVKLAAASGTASHVRAPKKRAAARHFYDLMIEHAHIF